MHDWALLRRNLQFTPYIFYIFVNLRFTPYLFQVYNNLQWNGVFESHTLTSRAREESSLRNLWGISGTLSFSWLRQVLGFRIRMGGEDDLSRAIDELCAALLSLLRSPNLAIPRDGSSLRRSKQRRRPSPAAVTWMLLGASLTLAIGGSVLLLIGIAFAPLVLGMLIAIYLIGIVSNLFDLGKAFFFPAYKGNSDPNFQHKSTAKLAT